jgi:hypothetical protein
MWRGHDGAEHMETRKQTETGRIQEEGLFFQGMPTVTYFLQLGPIS